MMINYTEDLTLKKVSDVVFISAFYLSHLFRKEMNTTFSDYLCKIRMEKAKGFLKNGKDFRIHEIAEKTGFNDPNYFAKTFKRMVGVAPKEYKKFFK
jgi:two-component system response regulator YesN